MTVKLGVNGFGRIGRLVTRAAREAEDVQITAVNASYDAETLAHVLKYDSVHGRFPGQVEAGDGTLIVDGREVRLTAERDPSNIPWAELGVDIVIEATGAFRTREAASKHLEAGATKVIITAPAKGEDVTIVYGVNHDQYDPASHDIISTASCTTNCLAPVAQVLDDGFGIEVGFLTTIHAYTSSQRLLDNPYDDLRRGREAANNIVPTTTGAARAIGKVLPSLDGRLNGVAVRVPVSNGSIMDLVVELRRQTTAEELNDTFRRVSTGRLEGILGYTDEPLVSSDMIDDSHSSTVDGLSTMVIGKMAKVFAWYDNEWGTANRIVDTARLVAQKL